MIIDLILDRKAGAKYNPKEFYDNVMRYGKVGWNIAERLDSGEEWDVKRALNIYIKVNEYNPEIAKYIDSVDWL